MRFVSRVASAERLQNLFNKLKSITLLGVLSFLGTTIMGANQRSWLAPPETSSRIPILTALSKSFLVCSLIANDTGITLVVRFAFKPFFPSLNSTFIFSTFIIESGCVWQTFMELDLYTLLRKFAQFSDRSPFCSDSLLNADSNSFLLNG